MKQLEGQAGSVLKTSAAAPRALTWRRPKGTSATPRVRREGASNWRPAAFDAPQTPTDGERHIWTGVALAGLAALIMARPLPDPVFAVPTGCYVLALASMVELIFVLRASAPCWANIAWALSASIGGVLLLALPLTGATSAATSLSFYLVVSASVLCSIASAQPQPRVLFVVAAVNIASAIVAIILQYQMRDWLFGVLLGVNVLSIAVAHIKLGLALCLGPAWPGF